MQTKIISIKGQVVLPGPLRRELGLRAGDALAAQIEAGRIVLTPLRNRRLKTEIVIDAVSRLPVLSAGSDAPVLTNGKVREILAKFP